MKGHIERCQRCARDCNGVDMIHRKYTCTWPGKCATCKNAENNLSREVDRGGEGEDEGAADEGAVDEGAVDEGEGGEGEGEGGKGEGNEGAADEDEGYASEVKDMQVK